MKKILFIILLSLSFGMVGGAKPLLSKEEAIADIDSLVYTLAEIHPDLFSVVSQKDFFMAVNRAKRNLPDSVTLLELYKNTAPLVAMIGDGHTSMDSPTDRVFTPDLKFCPVYFDVHPDKTLTCFVSIDSVIPKGDKILSINGVSADSLLNSMLPYVSGELESYKLYRLDFDFTLLLHMLLPAEEYDIEYFSKKENKTLRHKFPVATYAELRSRVPKRPGGVRKQPADYSYTIDSINHYAVMDFRRFKEPERMLHFADSMFRDLRSRKIDNLIIDIRNNPGGNSSVGDVLLWHLSPIPFTQFEKTLVKITPHTAKLLGWEGPQSQFILHETTSDDYIPPSKPEEGHYYGKVYLLTSTGTFSSASDFAWTFKETGSGTVIGEETGGVNVCFGDILRFQLPKSKLNVYVSYKRFWQMNADENDIHGTIPDIQVPASDAMKTAIKIITGKDNDG